MRDDAKRHGVFSLNELLTTDLASAKEFYGELLGWTFTETKNIHGKPYIVIHREGAVAGGMMLKDSVVPDDVPCLWDTYVSVDDVDAAAKRVTELGGQVVLPPTDIPKVGRFCVIRDPQGASLNLITYTDHVKKRGSGRVDCQLSDIVLWGLKIQCRGIKRLFES